MRVAVAEAEALEPAVEPLGFARGERAAGSGGVEHIVGARHDRHVDRGDALVGAGPALLHSRPARSRGR